MRRAFSAARAASTWATTRAGISSNGAEKDCAARESASKSARARRTARPPQRNSTRDGLANLLGFAEEQGADLAGGADVGAAAGAAVEPVDGDDAQRAFALGGFAQSLGFGGVLKANGHGPVLVDDFVGAALGFENGAGVDGGAFDVDGRAFRAEVKADGSKSEQLFEDGGEEVLAGVLLHVVEAAVPVDGAIDGAGVERRGEAVRDAVVLVDDVEDRDAADRAGVERLAAGGRDRRRCGRGRRCGRRRSGRRCGRVNSRR